MYPYELALRNSGLPPSCACYPDMAVCTKGIVAVCLAITYGNDDLHVDNLFQPLHYWPLAMPLMSEEDGGEETKRGPLQLEVQLKWPLTGFAMCFFACFTKIQNVSQEQIPTNFFRIARLPWVALPTWLWSFESPRHENRHVQMCWILGNHPVVKSECLFSSKTEFENYLKPSFLTHALNSVQMGMR